MKKNLFYVLTAAIALSFSFSACNGGGIEVTGVKLDKTTLTLVEGNEEALVATVSPENADNVNVTWASSDTAIATVSDGLVKAIAAGTATITAKTEDGNHTATCAVTVEAATIPVTGVTLDKTALTLGLEDSETLVATVLPSDATNANVTWSSSDTAVVTVENGLVTAVGIGTATITATTEDGNLTATCDVIVIGVTLDKAALTLGTEDKGTLVATVLPENAPNKNITWSSSDTSVATVADGTITAVAEGETTITVTTEDGGQTATCTVTVSWLGEVSFKTDKTWVIGSQTWSDAVMAARCKKDDYDGGVGLWTTPEYKIDCRQNEGYGDWFSWRAVDKYKAQLCPDGWRVPTTEDFKNLDIALGFSGENRGFDGASIQSYLNTWGGEFGGYVWVHYQTSELTLEEVGSYACYWSQDEQDPDRGSSLAFGTAYMHVSPQGGGDKYNGFSVRCVK